MHWSNFLTRLMGSGAAPPFRPGYRLIPDNSSLSYVLTSALVQLSDSAHGFRRCSTYLTWQSVHSRPEVFTTTTTTTTTTITTTTTLLDKYTGPTFRLGTWSLALVQLSELAIGSFQTIHYYYIALTGALVQLFDAAHGLRCWSYVSLGSAHYRQGSRQTRSAPCYYGA